MEVRPYLTAGAAIVTTGALVVATPAFVPAPTPPDVRISATAPEERVRRRRVDAVHHAGTASTPSSAASRTRTGLAASSAWLCCSPTTPLARHSPLSRLRRGWDRRPGKVVFPRRHRGSGVPRRRDCRGGLPADGQAVPVVNSFFAGGPNDTPGGIVGVADELTDGDAVGQQPSAFTGGIVGVAELPTS